MANVERNAEEAASEEEMSEYDGEGNFIDDSATEIESRPGTPGKEVSLTPPPEEVSSTAPFTEESSDSEKPFPPLREPQKKAEPSMGSENADKAKPSIVQRLSFPKKHPSTITMICDAVRSIGEKKGSTPLAIKNYIVGMHPDLDNNRFKAQFKRAFMKGIENGLLLRTKATQKAEGLKGRVLLASSKTTSKRTASTAKTKEIKEKPGQKHDSDSTNKSADDGERAATSKTAKKPPKKLAKKFGGTVKAPIRKTASPNPESVFSGDAAQGKPKKSRRTKESEASISGGKTSKKYKPSKERAPKEKAPKEKAPKEKAPKEKAPKEKAPKKKAPKEKAPKEKAPKEKGPKGKAPKEKAPQEKAPQERAPQERAPQARAPKERAPKKEADKDKPARVKVAKEKPAKGKGAEEKGAEALQMQPKRSKANPAKGKGAKKTGKA